MFSFAFIFWEQNEIKILALCKYEGTTAQEFTKKKPSDTSLIY